MFEIHPRIEISASPKKVWEYLSDIERWWVKSNPEHESLEILSNDNEIKEGTVLKIHEKVAGISVVAEGVICDLIPEKSVTWKANAIYRLFGIRFPVQEGVTWSIEPNDGSSELSAHVWAHFPKSLFGKISEWIFKHVLNGVEKDYEHAMCELRYIKQEVESNQA